MRISDWSSDVCSSDLNWRHPTLRRYVMRQTMLAVLLALALPSVALARDSNLHDGATTAAVQKALDDPARAADKADDARRKVAMVMTFAEVKPGQNVLELASVSGYWTCVFSAEIGRAHV